MVFLFILSGCQIFSNEKGTVMTSNDTVEKAAKISETSEKIANLLSQKLHSRRRTNR